MIGKKIKEKRLAKGWSQNDLAERIDSTQATIRNWELGLSEPSATKIVDLAYLFKTTTDELLGVSSTMYRLVYNGEKFEVDTILTGDATIFFDKTEAEMEAQKQNNIYERLGIRNVK